MSVAIQRGVSAGYAEGAGAKWNVGTVDPDQSLGAVIEAVYPDATEPYRVVEHFMNEGLRIVAETDCPPDVLALLDTPMGG